MTTATRPRLSPDFIAANNRKRLIGGLSAALTEKDYASVTVADVVRATGVAHNTFYDNFASKAAVGDECVRHLCPRAEEILPGRPTETSTGVMALEILAVDHAGDPVRAADELSWAQDTVSVLRDLAPREKPIGEVAPYLCQLPPGRHGLPPDFVAENQRRRLIKGVAICLSDDTYADTTIAGIVSAAAVSRRSFYEHFESRDDAVVALVKGSDLDAHYAPAEMASGLAAFIAEVVAVLHLGHSAGGRLDTAESVLEAVAESFEDEA